MAEDDRPTRPPIAGEVLERRLRYVAAGVMLVCVVVLVIASTIGVHVSEVMFGTLVSAILLLLGVAALNRLSGIRS